MLSVSLQIDKDSSRPLHLQVSDAMEKAIADGAFRGSKLPSVRGLAQRLKISPATVTAAYRTLVSRRLVEASPRSGFVVSAESQALKTPEVFALDKLQPNLRMHPVAEFGRLIAEVAAREIDSGGYEDFRGNKKLRERLAELGEESGVAADPSMEIFITEGCQQALALTAQIMGPGAKVAIPDPSYPGAHLAFQQAGAKLIPVPSGEDGPNLRALEAISGSIDLLYCCPTYGNPTGYSWRRKTREKIASLAARKGFVIFEDDYLGDLDYLDEKQPRLKALAPQAKIIHVRTFSKCILPALRIASVTADAQTIDLLLKKRIASDISGSPFLQRALALFLERGRYAKHLDQARPFYKSVREALRKELGKSGSGICYGDPPAGLSLFAELPKGIDALHFAAECEKLGVRIAPGKDYFINPLQGSSSFRLCFGGIEPTDTPFVAKALARACERAALGSESGALV